MHQESLRGLSPSSTSKGRGTAHDQPVAQLEQLAETGSVSRAAWSPGISEPLAYAVLDHPSNLAGYAHIDGAEANAGCTLTPRGVEVVTADRAFDLEQRHCQKLSGPRIEDFGAALPRYRRLALRTRASNQFFGNVTALKSDMVTIGVEVSLPGGDRIDALVTDDSATQLGLTVGASVFTLFKESAVLIATGEDVTGIRAQQTARSRDPAAEQRGEHQRNGVARWRLWSLRDDHQRKQEHAEAVA